MERDPEYMLVCIGLHSAPQSTVSSAQEGQSEQVDQHKARPDIGND